MRSPSLRSLATVALTALAGLAGAGCIAIAAGAAAGYGAYKVSSNGESRSYNAPLDRTWAAAMATMREYGYPIADAPHGPGGGSVTMNGLTVNVSAPTTETTVVTVKQGTFDSANHRATSDALLDSIGKKLGVSP